MPIAYFDPISGAAGDMILGSLIDAGLSLAHLEQELAKLDLTGYSISARRVQKQHIAATQFLVHVDGVTPHQDRHHAHGATHHDAGRAMSDILDLIAGSALSGAVKETASAIFRRLGEAEAKVHGVAGEDVHFHEIGDIDSIVDIVGASIAFDVLRFSAVYCAPLPVGSGTIQTRHGIYPIPAPATLELIARAGADTRPSRIQAEQVTPTGAAILTEIATFVQPPMRVTRVGYGSGEADLEIPNVLRVWIGETEERGTEPLSVVETNIDDMNPELYGAAVDACFRAGALDVLMIPAIMKKGRPAVKLEVLCEAGRVEAIVHVLLRETSTLGVRCYTVDRYSAARETAVVDTSYGQIRVKVKRLNGQVTGAAPEYDDCVRVASQSGVPAMEVFGAAMAAGRALLSEQE